MNLSAIMSNRKTAASTTGLDKKYLETDLLYEDLSSLVNSQFKAWYCSRFYALGRERVLILASQARADGKDPVKLFSYLLRKP